MKVDTNMNAIITLSRRVSRYDRVILLGYRKHMILDGHLLIVEFATDLGVRHLYWILLATDHSLSFNINCASAHTG